MKQWVEGVGRKAGISPGSATLCSGAVGAPESRIEVRTLWKHSVGILIFLRWSCTSLVQFVFLPFLNWVTWTFMICDLQRRQLYLMIEEGCFTAWFDFLEAHFSWWMMWASWLCCWSISWRLSFNHWESLKAFGEESPQRNMSNGVSK